MKITLLGTGTSQGVPVVGCRCAVCLSSNHHDKRLRSSVYVEVADKKFVIDTGPDFRQQMLREDIGRLDAVLLTHHHKDHTGGLDDIRALNFKQNRHIPIYGNRHAMDHIKKEYYYAFADEKYPGSPEFELHQIDARSFTIQDTVFIPLPVWHLNLPILGFRIGDFSYITDANNIPDETFEKLKNTKKLVLNALQKEPHISHFNLQEAIATAKKIDASQTYFTHISHKMGLHNLVEEELPKGINLGYDGMTITV